MKIAIISLLPDTGHMISLLRLGELLQKNGDTLMFFGPKENNTIAKQRNIPHHCLTIERPENYNRQLEKYSRASRFWQEVIWSKWFYINYYEKAIYSGLQLEETLIQLVKEFNADAILCDSHLFTATYESIAKKCNLPIIFNIAPGSYADFQNSNHASGIFNSHNQLTIKLFKKLIGNFYTAFNRLFFPTKFERDRQISDHLHQYWETDSKDTPPKQNQLSISTGIGFLEKKYLADKIHIPPSVFQVSSLPQNPPGLISPDLLHWINQADTPIIYVGFGTMVKGEIPFAKNIINAAKNCGFRILWSHPTNPFHGWKNDTWTRWESWVSQINILSHEKVKVFISHGGSGAMQESIWFGKPIICIPFLWDQFYNAWVIKVLCGIPVLNKKSISTAIIRNHIKLALQKTDLFKKYSDDLRANEGSNEIVKKIRDFLATCHNPVS